ncbi:D-aminoacyl-tRNA deacylase [Deinococcus peraridilitoris]|uniref:D-aminoacyl-tRNA deacylase n=1 Tax=Deinococcus peraridilitoris (strain DSM 19664 / LMG 22246 / CIP 109416 / KR-200) TaxID=937777 RepID=K9ZWN5_DEIPD|nr:D-aminoacyl-tRNA deacylase [Deinococcus peraridilitoris]AFZ65996.1 D-tyrosyl-tRNA(Tyr) deacylase [Deinococcus peraridilitoris DSM 19664]
MKALLQRVARASVRVDGQLVGQVGQGLLILLGVGQGDAPEQAHKLAEKIARLRIFSDDAGKMNLSIVQVGGAVLSVSQFTLYADTRKGNRPSFVDAAAPEQGRALYQIFNEALRAQLLQVEEGIFGADMQVELVNDGPVTVLLEA